MNNNKENITSNQLIIFIIAAQVGIGILTLPAKLASTAGHDGWISVIISTFICFIIITIIVLLLKRYEGRSIIQINSILYGKFLGSLFNLYITLYMLFTSCFLFRSLIDIIQILVLSYTPAILICFITIGPTLYLCTFGLKHICRYSVLIYLVIAITLIQILLVAKNFKITFLMPVGSAGLIKIAASLNVSVISFLGFELVAIVYPYVTDKKNVLKKALAANFITGMFYILVVLATTSLFGENFLERLVYPLFNMSRIYQAPVFERLDLFYVSLWFPAMAGSTRMYLYSTQLALRDLFKLKPKKIYVFIHIFIMILLSRIPKNVMDLERYSNYLSYLSVSVIALITFSYFFSFINKRGVRKNEA